MITNIIESNAIHKPWFSLLSRMCTLWQAVVAKPPIASCDSNFLSQSASCSKKSWPCFISRLLLAHLLWTCSLFVRVWVRVYASIYPELISYILSLNSFILPASSSLHHVKLSVQITTKVAPPCSKGVACPQASKFPHQNKGIYEWSVNNFDIWYLLRTLYRPSSFPSMVVEWHGTTVDQPSMMRRIWVMPGTFLIYTQDWTLPFYLFA